jgi:hypothetical protein
MRLGGGFVVNFAGSVEFTPVVNLLVPLVGDAPQPSGLNPMLAVRMRPLGSATPWYVGTGITGLYLSERLNGPYDMATQRDEAHHVLLTGVSFPTPGSERP